MSRFRNNLDRLGFSSYADYLASEHWKEFKTRYRAGGFSTRCAVCEGGPIHLHHHTYDDFAHLTRLAHLIAGLHI